MKNADAGRFPYLRDHSVDIIGLGGHVGPGSSGFYAGCCSKEGLTLHLPQSLDASIQMYKGTLQIVKQMALDGKCSMILLVHGGVHAAVMSEVLLPFPGASYVLHSRALPTTATNRGNCDKTRVSTAIFSGLRQPPTFVPLQANRDDKKRSLH